MRTGNKSKLVSQNPIPPSFLQTQSFQYVVGIVGDASVATAIWGKMGQRVNDWKSTAREKVYRVARQNNAEVTYQEHNEVIKSTYEGFQHS